MNTSIIWLDDDLELMNKSEPFFRDHGFALIKCTTSTQALKFIREGASQNLLLDIVFPNSPKDGLLFLEQITQIAPELNVVIFTGYPEVIDAVKLIKEKMAADYIPKPIPASKEGQEAFVRKLRESFFSNEAEKRNTNQVQKESAKKVKLDRKEKIALIGLVVAITVLLFGNNIWDRLSWKNDSVTTNDSTPEIESNRETTLAKIQLPYLENVPIIDKGLYIQYYYNDFVIGGINVNTIRINARAKTGESMNLSKSNNEIHMDITKEPYIEFEYKGCYFSIETSGSHYLINCIIKKNVEPTFSLKGFDEI